MGSLSRFLFADPTVISGAGSIFDFCDFLTEFNTSRTAVEADARAHFADWEQVYEDLADSEQRLLTEVPECRKVQNAESVKRLKRR